MESSIKVKYLVRKSKIIFKLLGHRITDEFPVVIKQVPRSKINKLMKIKDRYIPAEFYFHMQASECNGVVKVILTYFVCFLI